MQKPEVGLEVRVDADPSCQHWGRDDNADSVCGRIGVPREVPNPLVSLMCIPCHSTRSRYRGVSALRWMILA